MNHYVIYTLVGVLVAFVLYKSVAGKSSSEEARRLVDAGAMLLDVRSPAEFSSGHIDGAKNIPVDELSSRISEVGPKEKPVVVYCRSGARSGSATRVLRGAGFTQVYDLGSMSAW
ncbi:MAG: rhodanese-like domain-containing protein [Deltaproteobacteria bacterium]|nr:rhodanese-like domain-containing protein [Deltaproteobacteria bacterium]